MKTAMQELIEKFSNYDLEMISLFKDEINQAKEKEKEQIMKAAKVILFASTGQGDAAAEKYYNETYNQNK